MDDLKIKRPYAVFVEEGDDGTWIAHIVGPDGLDNMTQANDPVDALFMAHDLLMVLTGGCKPMDRTPHDFNIDTTLSDPCEQDFGTIYLAKQCSRCGEIRRIDDAH